MSMRANISTLHSWFTSYLNASNIIILLMLASLIATLAVAYLNTIVSIILASYCLAKTP